MYHRTVTCSVQLQNSEEGIINPIQALFIIFLTWMEDVHFKGFFWTFICIVCEYVHVCMLVDVHMPGHTCGIRELIGVCSLLPPLVFWGSNSDYILTTYLPSCCKHLNRMYSLLCGGSFRILLYFFKSFKLVICSFLFLFCIKVHKFFIYILESTNFQILEQYNQVLIEVALNIQSTYHNQYYQAVDLGLMRIALHLFMWKEVVLEY